MFTNILIADDHPVVRQGLKNIITELFPAARLFQAGNFNTVVAALREHHIDLLICDINMPGSNPTILTNTIRLFSDQIKVLLFSAYKEETYAPRYMKAGAMGYLSKDAQEEEIKTALLTVGEGNRYVSEQTASQLTTTEVRAIPVSMLDTLSGRELEVAHLLCQGLGLLEISNAMKLKVSTVSTYKIRLYEKLNISNVVDLVGIMA